MTVALIIVACFGVVFFLIKHYFYQSRFQRARRRARRNAYTSRKVKL